MTRFSARPREILEIIPLVMRAVAVGCAAGETPRRRISACYRS
jgi:hypothetical protein